MAVAHVEFGCFHAVLPALQRQFTDHADGGQGLAPEAHRVDGGQVFTLGQFGRGVTVHRQHEVVGVNAPPVVADTDEVEAAALDGHVDVARACVQAVLEQFFHNLSRPLDDLTGRNVSDGEVIELLNSALSHSIPPSGGRGGWPGILRPDVDSCHPDPRWQVC